MKRSPDLTTLTLRMAAAAAVLLSIAAGFAPAASAQEEELKAAVAMREEQSAKIKKMGETIQNFSFLRFARVLVEKLEGRKREVDPFGTAMDPEKELAELVVESAEPEVEEPKVKTSLEEALSKFHVTGIFPGRREIMIGAQTLKQGDRLLIKHQTVSFQLEIAGIDSKEVRLKDVETGELATVPHGMMGGLPAGMQREKPEVTEEPVLSESGTIVPMSQRLITLE